MKNLRSHTKLPGCRNPLHLLYHSRSIISKPEPWAVITGIAQNPTLLYFISKLQDRELNCIHLDIIRLPREQVGQRHRLVPKRGSQSPEHSHEEVTVE
jgi:hypothetical protein